MNNNYKILVIDDEPQIRKLLKLTLEANNFEVVCADNARNGINLCASISPDLILLDLNLPDIDGLSTLIEIREWSKTKIIVLSVRSSEIEKIKLLDSGADDYITKPFHSGELLARIRVALRHQSPAIDEPIIKVRDIEINFSSHNVKKNNVAVNLTSTEYAILKLLISNKGKVLTHHDILESIWGRTFSEEIQYLRVFIGQIRKKIEKDPSKPIYLKTIPGVGYMFFDE